MQNNLRLNGGCFIMTGATGEARTLNDAVGRHDFIQLDYGRIDIKFYNNYGLKQCSQPLRYPVWV